MPPAGLCLPEREKGPAVAGRGFPLQGSFPAWIKENYTLPPARTLRREGRPVRPWREAHSLSPCPDGQRQRLRTRKPDPIARVLHPRSDNTRCCPADSSWACPPGSRRIDVYSYKVPARPEAKSALQGRGTGLARWWGHEVLKGPNTLAGVRSHFPGIQQRKLQTLRPCSYPYTPLLSAGPAKYRLSPMPPPPSLRMVPSYGISDRQRR